MKSPLDSTGGDSALKSAFDLVLYRFEMAQMGPFLTMLMSILVLVRGLFQKSSYKEMLFQTMVLI